MNLQMDRSESWPSWWNDVLRVCSENRKLNFNTSNGVEYVGLQMAKFKSSHAQPIYLFWMISWFVHGLLIYWAYSSNLGQVHESCKQKLISVKPVFNEKGSKTCAKPRRPADQKVHSPTSRVKNELGQRRLSELSPLWDGYKQRF